MVEDKIKEIRKCLRLAMNGVISSSMREKGVVYKLNFGVPYPEIKQIAASFEQDDELASALWKEDIREFKIMATLLQPVESFTCERAKEWIKEIPHLEIAEYCSKNLFCKLPGIEKLTMGLIYNVNDFYARTVAYLIWSELFKEGKDLIPPIQAAFLVESMRTTLWTDFGAPWMEKQAAIKAMKFYGRQSSQRAAHIMNMFDVITEYKDVPEQVEIYNDLKFEFEYYR